MKKIKILHWDDKSSEKQFSEVTVNDCLKELNIETEYIEFTTKQKEFENLIKENEFDLIILDLESEKDNEKESKKGFELLNDIILKYKNKIPILIWTIHDNFSSIVNNFRNKYSLNIKLLPKSLKTDPNFIPKVKETLYEMLSSKPEMLEIITYNDVNTQHTISKIGIENINGLITKYFKIKYNQVQVDRNIIKSVRAINPGYSRAYLIVVEFKTYSKLFKLSNNYTQIMTEYRNLKQFADQIKSALRVDYERIDPDDIFYNGWYTIIYEYIPHNKSLFDWLSDIGNKNKTNEIENIFKNIFSKHGILQLNKVDKTLEKPVNENILQDIDKSRVSYINTAYKELSIILKQFESDYKCNKEDILDSILENHSYSYISKSKIKTPTSKLYLSHNDLHANNILLDDQNIPRIIDPGNVQEKHWSSDICRLLVNLIIRGLDTKEIDFFKLETITKWFDPIINLIRDKSNLEINDKYNNIGFIMAINWLRNNVEKIYSDRYKEWEFQLGIVVELLKSSYKTESLPPGKRALAIMLACKVLEIANENLKNKLLGDK